MTDSSWIPPGGFKPSLPPGQRPGNSGPAADGFQRQLQQATAGGRLPDSRPPDRETVLWLVRVVRQQLNQAISAAFGGGARTGGALGGGPGGSLTGGGSSLTRLWLAHMGGPNPAGSQTAAPSGQPAAPKAPAEAASGPRAAGRDQASRSAEDGPDASGGDALFADAVRDASDRFDVPERLVRAVIRAESDFDPDAVSHAGAKGLMQLMPETANDLGVTDPFDPRQNIMGGTRYLRMLLDRYDGDRELALAAYNWGMGNLERNPDPLPDETVNYVRKIHDLLGESTA
jgi:hypothetical protein